MTTGNANDRDLRAKLSKWLRDEEWTVTVTPGKKGVWMLTAARDKDRVNVALDQRRPEIIELSAGITIGPDHEQKLSLISSEAFNNFLRSLTIDMLGRNLEVQIILPDDDSPKMIWFHSRVCFDGPLLSMDVFWQRFILVQNATKATSLKLGEFLDDAFIIPKTNTTPEVN